MIYDDKTLPPPDFAEIERIKAMRDEDIDTSDIPELNASQLREAAAIARKKRRFADTEPVTMDIGAVL